MGLSKATGWVLDHDVVLKAIVAASQDAIFVKDALGVYRLISPVAVRMIGRPPKEILGRSDHDLFAPELADRLRDVDLAVMAEGQALVYETAYAVNGRKLVLETRKTPYLDADGRCIGIVGIARDVSEKKQVTLQRGRLIQRLRERNRLLKGRQREDSRMQAGVAHDLRNPLSAIKTLAQMIIRHPENALRHAGRIVDSVDRCDLMVEDFLAAYQSEMAARTSAFADFDLVELVRQAVEDLSCVYGNRFTFVATSERVGGTWNASLIRRLLENLCQNAIRYGDRVAKITVTVDVDATGGTACLRVHNFGAPISDLECCALMDPAIRAPRASTCAKGWGLGLMVIKKIVIVHEGILKVESSERDGTTFEARLPRLRGPLSSSGRSRESAHSPRPHAAH